MSFILRFRPLFLVVLSFLSVLPLRAQGRQTLQRHVRAEVSSRRAALVGAMPADHQIRASIVLALRNPDALTSLLGRLYDPKSPDYRHFLTVDQFTSQFSPSASDLQAVVAFAQANGLTVGELPANRMVVPISGTAAQMGAAFNLQMNVYQHPTENRTFFSLDREPSLNLSVPVAHIAGLDDFSVPKHMSEKRNASTPTGQQAATVLGSGPSGSYLGSDMRAAYYGGSALTGNGQAVALLEFGGYALSDVALTFANAGQTYSVPVNNVLLDGATGAPYESDAEEALDIVQAIGMAPGLSQVRVYIGIGSDDPVILNSMASENLARQISCSWGWRPADPTTDDVFFEEMAAQGQSFFTASGDSGAWDAAISPFFYPADDQYVTAVGGTHLTTTGAAGSWLAETVWNSYQAGSGGGVSPDGITIPSWQTGVATSANGGSATLRNSPDVAMEGDFDNYACSLGTCEGDYAGTSFASPRWAGFMALVNQQAVEAGNAPMGGVGFLNPSLYQLGQAQLAQGSGGGDFHDIVLGNNDTKSQPVWFNAEPGYDLTTGWGSANGQQLIDDLAGPQVPGFWMASSQSAIGIDLGSSATTTIVITDAGGFSGPVTLAIASTLPTGVTASFSANPVTGSSVLTLSAPASASGTSTLVTVTGTSGTLTASTNFTVTAHAPTFSLAAPSTVNLSQGGTATATLAMQSLYGFTGTANLSISGLPAGVSASFSPASTSGSGTSTLTFTATGTATPGTGTVVVTGTSGSIVSTVNIVLAVHAPSFVISASPSFSMGQGSSASTYVYVTPQYGFSGSVTFSISGLPSGVTATFSPNQATSETVLNFVTSSSAATGTSVVTITATAGSLTSSTNINLTVNAPSFELTTPNTVTIGQGNSSTTYINVSDLYGFNGLVNLAVTGLPSGVTASFFPNPVATSTILTLTASSGASLGNSTLTITGTSGSLTSSTTFTLGVYAPTFTLSASSTSVGQGSSGSTYVSLNNQYGFSGSVNLAVSGLPAGVTASFGTNPTTGSSVLTFNASSSAAIGNSTITITGTSGSITASTTITLGIFAPAFTMSASNVGVGQGSTGYSYVYVTSQYGFSGNVALSLSGLPAGVTAAISPNPTTGNSQILFTASSAAAVGSSLLTVTGTSGSMTVSTTMTLGIYAQTFTLSSTSSVAVGQGSSTTGYVYVTGAYGFSGAVNLNVSGLPAGVTATISPNPTTSTATVIFTASVLASAGQSTVTITGTSGSMTATTILSLGVYVPTFTLNTGGTFSMGPGTSQSTGIYINRDYGFSGGVSLSVAGLPNGVTSLWTPNPTTGTSSSLSLTVGNSVPAGTYPLTITGVSGSLSTTTTTTLTVTAPSFTLSASAVTLGQGTSASGSVSVSPQNGFTGNVTLSITGLPSGVTASFSQNPTTGTSLLTFTADSAAALGQSVVTVTGTSGTLSASISLYLTIAVPSFTITNYGGSFTLGQGGSSSNSLYVNGQGGFAGPVTFSVSGLPSGVTASFSPSPTFSGVLTTLTLSASTAAAVGQYTLIVTGTSGPQSASTVVALTVLAPAFTLSTSGNVSMGQASSYSNNIYVNSTNGVTANVTFSVSGLPSGVTASFSPNPTTYGSTLTLNTSATAAPGQYTLTVTGTAGTSSASTQFTLTVSGPTFTLYSYESISAAQGGAGTSYIYVNDLNGFTGNVTLSASGLPSGVTASFSPNPTSYSSYLTLTTSSSTPLGQYTVTVTGTSGNITSSMTIPLGVYAPTFTLSGPTSVSITQGATAAGYFYTMWPYSTAQSATLSVSGLPSGVTATFSPNQTTYSSELTFSAASNAAIGTSTITVTATAGALVQTLTFPLSVVAPNFSLYGSTTSISVNQGTMSGSFYTYLQSSTGFANSVTMSISGLPAGVTGSFSPNPTTYDSFLTLTASSAAAPGTYTVTITGTSGTYSASLTVPLMVNAEGFTITGPADVLLAAGALQMAGLTVTPVNGFTGSVNLAASGLPAGVTATITPNSTTSASVLTLTAAANATPGSGAVTITGTSGSLSASTTIPVTVLARPSATAVSLAITAGANPASTVAAGTMVTATASVTAGATPVTAGQINLCDTQAATCSLLQVVGTAQITSAGTAVLQFVPGPGTHHFIAFFAGTRTNAASASAAANLTVTATLPTTTTLIESGSAGNYTLSATVTGQGPVAPTGTVSFLDLSNGTFSLGSAALASGVPAFSFNTAQTPATGSEPEAVASGDFNGDGILDLAVANTNSNSVTILLGNGNGTFTPGATLPTGAGPDSVAVGDFNRDGHLDLVVASSSGGGVNVYLGNGDGTFTASNLSPQTGANPIAMVVGDLNGDGLLDIAVANSGSSTITVLLGNGDGTFTTSANSPAVGNEPRSIALGDFNGDDVPDLAVVNFYSGSISILLGVGDGTFSAAPSVTAVFDPSSIAVGDFNGDGKLDLAVASQYSYDMSVYLGNGDGTFTLGAAPVTNSFGEAVAVGDFNGDGKADIIAVATTGSGSTLFLGHGNGTFAAGITTNTGSSPYAFAIGDWNGDGINDVAIANESSNTLTILTSQLMQTATASATGISPLGTGQHAVDANYPGDAVYKGSGSSSVLLTAKAGAPTLTLSLSSSTITTLQTLLVTVTVSGGSSNPVPTGSIYLIANSTQLPAGVLSNGSVSFTVPVGTFVVGTDTIGANYLPDTNSAAVYTRAGAGTTVTVTKTTPTVTWANPAPMVYGTVLSATQLNAAASVPGTFLYSPAAGFILAAGPQTLQVLFTPTDTADYTTASASVPITVNPPYSVWIANGNGSVSALTQLGDAVTPSALQAGGTAVAVDGNGNIWSLNRGTSSLAEFAQAGSILNAGFTGGGLNQPAALAIDGGGVIWIANGNNTVSTFSITGVPVSPTSYGASIPTPTSVSIDGSGSVWITNAGDNSVTQMIGVASPVITPTATGVKNGTLGGKP